MLSKEEIIDILDNDKENIENGNWEGVYEHISDNIRGDFSDFLIENEIDPGNMFKYKIPDYAFQESKLLKSVDISNSVTEIGWYAFQNCESLEYITLPDNIIIIKEGAFAWCSSLKSITIPKKIKTIRDYAFSHCSSLKSITIPNKVNRIGEFAFASCTSLISITIPTSVTKISRAAFLNCASLEEIKYDGTEEEWEKVKKGQDWDLHCSAKVIFLK